MRTTEAGPLVDDELALRQWTHWRKVEVAGVLSLSLSSRQQTNIVISIVDEK